MNFPNRIFIVVRFSLILSLGILFVGCTSTAQKPAAAVAESLTVIPAPPSIPSAPEKRIMFGFDSSLVMPGYDQEIQAHITYMKTYPTTKVTIEGHSDSHGPAEYNIGLGKQRALTVQAMMIENGIEMARIHVTSLGEGKPLDETENRAAWAKNRRVEFVYAE